VEQRTVDDGVVARAVTEIHRVGDLEPGVHAVGLGIAAGLLDRPCREVNAEDVITQPGEQDRVFARSATDVEYLAADLPGAFQLDDRGLWFADHPGRGARTVKLVETGEVGCRIHE
jgi:hypothetical protein